MIVENAGQAAPCANCLRKTRNASDTLKVSMCSPECEAEYEWELTYGKYEIYEEGE